MFSGTGPTLRKQTHWCPDSLQANVGHPMLIRRSAGKFAARKGSKLTTSRIFRHSIRTVREKTMHVLWRFYLYLCVCVSLFVMKCLIYDKRTCIFLEYGTYQHRNRNIMQVLGNKTDKHWKSNSMLSCPVIQKKFQTHVANFQCSSIFLHSISVVVASKQNASIEVATIHGNLRYPPQSYPPNK